MRGARNSFRGPGGRDGLRRHGIRQGKGILMAKGSVWRLLAFGPVMFALAFAFDAVWNIGSAWTVAAISCGGWGLAAGRDWLAAKRRGDSEVRGPVVPGARRAARWARSRLPALLVSGVFAGVFVAPFEAPEIRGATLPIGATPVCAQEPPCGLDEDDCPGGSNGGGGGPECDAAWSDAIISCTLCGAAVAACAIGVGPSCLAAAALCTRCTMDTLNAERVCDDGEPGGIPHWTP